MLEQYVDFKMPETLNGNHWHQFVDAILGQGKTQANFDYAGPLTESVLLGCVASRFNAVSSYASGVFFKFLGLSAVCLIFT